MTDETQPVTNIEESLNTQVQEVAKQEETLSVAPEAAPVEAPAPVVEAPVAEPVAAPAVPNTEVLEESLSVIKEVRTELANAYNAQKSAMATIEQLNAEIAGYKAKDMEVTKTVESLSSELNAYKARDAEVAKTAYTKRLESLAANFEKLGQKKTVEQLSALDESVVGEFEQITGLALRSKSEESLAAPLTVAAQAMPTPAPAAPVQVAPAKKVEQLSTRDVMMGVIGVLQAQQNSSGNAGKRIVTM